MLGSYFLQKHSIIDVWQCSEHASCFKFAMVQLCQGFEYASVLNMSGFWIDFFRDIRKLCFLKYKDFFGVSVSRKLGAFLRKYKKLFQSRFLREIFCGLRPESLGSHFRKYKNSFPLGKYKKFFQSRFFFRKKYKKFFR